MTDYQDPLYQPKEPTEFTCAPCGETLPMSMQYDNDLCVDCGDEAEREAIYDLTQVIRNKAVMKRCVDVIFEELKAKEKRAI